MVVGDLQIRETTETNRETRLCRHHHHQYYFISSPLTSEKKLTKVVMQKNNAKKLNLKPGFPSIKWFLIEAVMSFPTVEVINVGH